MLLAKLLLATFVAGTLLLLGIVFTMVMFQSDQHPDDWGRTWQDNVLIVSVLTLYLCYVLKAVYNFFKGD